MKTIYIINGPMGVGKTTVCKQLNKSLNNSVYLDGDWCWNMDPFIVTDSSKKMVMENICFLLNNFIKYNLYENIIFSWVIPNQIVLDEITNNINCNEYQIKKISLVCTKNILVKRLIKDIDEGLRDKGIIERSLKIFSSYDEQNTFKIDTSNISINEIIEIIKKL